MAAEDRVQLMGFSIDPIDEGSVAATILGALDEGRGGSVLTMNLDILRRLARERELEPLFARADLVVADGTPLVWATRLKGTPVPERVAGSDLVWSLSAEAAVARRRVFLLGAPPGVSEDAELALRRRYPELDVAGTYAPPLGFEPTPATVREIAPLVRAAAPDVVYVALGFPKQERVIAALRDELPHAWFIGVGAGLDFLSGQVRRAPDWVGRLGLEWAHRLLQEPRRLMKRYLLYGVPFAAVLLRYAVGCRLAGRDLARPRVKRQGPPLYRPASGTFRRGAIERERDHGLRLSSPR